jgi:hypothetical protein
LALEQALGEWILLLNPDAYVLPGCLQQLVNTLQSDLKIGAVSPIAQWDDAGNFLLPPGQMQSPAWEWLLTIGLRFPFFGRWLSMRFKNHALRCLYARRPICQNMLSGGHMLLRRSAIDAVNGLFDPSFFMYYEDTDLCRRLTKAGFELMLDPAAKVVHEWRNDTQKSKYVIASRFRYLHKHFPSIGLSDKLRQKFEQRFPQKIIQFHDLGISTISPNFDLPTHQKGNWLFELSPNPLLIPAAYHSSSAALNSIPSSIWSLLGPAHYWVRVTHPNGQASNFTWEIPTSAQTLSVVSSPKKQIGNVNKTWHFDWGYPADKTELLSLFLEVFGHEMSPELWRWKYQNLDTLGTLVRRDDRIVAFYGGMPRTIHLLGSPTTAVQIGDVMVHPKERGILTRKGPFFLATTSFLESFVGQHQAFPIAFGFPSERAYRLSVHLGLYDKVGELMQVSWPALQTRPSYKVHLRPLKPDQGQTVDRLWWQMAEALQDQVVGVRDWDYVQRRYLQHPTLDYQLYQVSSRLTGKSIGIIVLRILDDTIELVDIIAQPRHLSTLVHCLRRLTWSLGKSQAYTWITTQNAALFDGEITPTGIVIPHNRWTPGIPASELLDRWWLMGGDTDFR